MDNKEKLKKIFIESLSIEGNKFTESLEYNDIPEWDSIGHMTLMSELEDNFDITISTEDLIQFESYKQGVEILDKYSVKVN